MVKYAAGEARKAEVAQIGCAFGCIEAGMTQGKTTLEALLATSPKQTGTTRRTVTDAPRKVVNAVQSGKASHKSLRTPLQSISRSPRSSPRSRLLVLLVTVLPRWSTRSEREDGDGARATGRCQGQIGASDFKPKAAGHELLKRMD
jgi:hypothetical protein